MPVLSPRLQRGDRRTRPSRPRRRPIPSTSAAGSRPSNSSTSSGLVAASGEVDACIVVCVEIDVQHRLDNVESLLAAGDHPVPLALARSAPVGMDRQRCRPSRRPSGRRLPWRLLLGVAAGWPRSPPRMTSRPNRTPRRGSPCADSPGATAPRRTSGGGSIRPARSSCSRQPVCPSRRGPSSDRQRTALTPRIASGRLSSSRRTSVASCTSRRSTPCGWASAMPRPRPRPTGSSRSGSAQRCAALSCNPSRRRPSSCSSAPSATLPSDRWSSSAPAAWMPSYATIGSCSSRRCRGRQHGGRSRACVLLRCSTAWAVARSSTLHAVVDLVHRVSLLAATTPEIEQLDLDPVLVGTSGCVAVDAVVAISAPATTITPARGLRGRPPRFVS